MKSFLYRFLGRERVTRQVRSDIVARLFFAALVMGLLLIFGRPINAQPQCNDRDSVLDLLAKKYKEAPVAVGVTNTGGLIEVLSAGGAGTWTIIVTTPQGMSCLVAAGEGWRSVAPKPPEVAAPRT